MEPISYPVLPSLSAIPERLDIEISRKLLSEVSAARANRTQPALERAIGCLKALSSLHERGFRPEESALPPECVREIRCSSGESISFVGSSPFLARLSPEGGVTLLSLLDGSERQLALSAARPDAPCYSRLVDAPAALFLGYADGEVRMHCLSSGELIFKYRIDGSVTGAALGEDGRSVAIAYGERRYFDDHLFRYGMTPSKPMCDGVGTLDVFSRDDTMFGERWCRRASYVSPYGRDGYLYSPAFAASGLYATAANRVYALEMDGSGGEKLASREPALVAPCRRIAAFRASASGTFALLADEGVSWSGAELRSLSKTGDVASFALSDAAPQIAICDSQGLLRVLAFGGGGLEPVTELRLANPIESVSFSPSGKALLVRSGGQAHVVFDHPELHSS